MSALMVSISGVRGIVGETLTPEVVLAYASAFAEYCGYGTVVVGRDSRVTGELVRQVVFAGLVSSGCKVIDLGICTTPGVQVMVKHLKADGGIIITASHNPVQWNALKFVGNKGFFLSKEDNTIFMPLAAKSGFKRVLWDEVKKIEAYPDAIRIYTQKLLKFSLINKLAIKKKKFKVVIDCVNGAGSVMCPGLLRALGCRVVELNCKPDGLFPHEPEPTPANLKQLCAAVKKHKAHVGFAVDPDADRLAIVSEKGVAIGEEYTLALCADYFLSRKKGPVVVNLSTSRMINDVCEKYGVKLTRTPVGEINVSTELVRQKGVFGGEGNGGAMAPEIHACRDACTGMELVLQYMAASGKSVSGLVASLPAYAIVKTKYDCSAVDMARAFDRFKNGFPGGAVDEQDGIRVDIGKSWVQLRKSNTEPVARIIAEAPTAAEAQQLTEQAKALLFG